MVRKSLVICRAVISQTHTVSFPLVEGGGRKSGEGSPRVKAELQENASVTALKQEAECLNAPSHNTQDCSGLWDVIDCKI